MSDLVQKQTAPGSSLISARGARPLRNQRSQDMDCLICGANAEQIPTANDGVGIFCPICGEYDVARAVLATGQLSKLEPDQRRDVLDKAKHSAQPDARP